MTTVTWRSQRPLDLSACFARFSRWGPHPLVEFRDGTAYRLASRAEGALPYSAKQSTDGSVVLESDDPNAALSDLQYRLAESLDRTPVETLAAADGRIDAALAKRPGYRPPLEPDLLVALVGLVTAQQVNLRWANTTLTRIVHTFGTPHRWQELELWEFPAAATLAEADPTTLRKLQLTTAKSEFIVAIATACAGGQFGELGACPDAEAIERLTAVRGIGRWTADWVLARHLGRPHIVAGGDLGVRTAVQRYLGSADRPGEAEVRRTTALWGDAANWAIHLLLEELAETPTPR